MKDWEKHLKKSKEAIKLPDIKPQSGMAKEVSFDVFEFILSLIEPVNQKTHCIVCAEPYKKCKCGTVPCKKKAK